MNSAISVIMPVKNEALTLRSSLNQLSLSDTEELIIVDGGSTDNTVSIAREFTEKVFTSKTGRASVMNYGAHQSAGDILLFLHADCVLPENAFEIIRESLSDRSVAAGAFSLGIDKPGSSFRLIEYASNIRAKVTSLIYGDQGMFLRKQVFDNVGGFADIPLMEDIEISKRLKKAGRIVFVKPPIKASARRWVEEGVIHTTLRDWGIAFSYTFMKVPAEKLIKHYREIR